MKKLNELLIRCVNIIFLLISLWIFIIAGLKSVKRYSIGFIFLLAIILCISYCFQKKYGEKIVEWLNKKRFLLMLIVCFFVMLIVAFALRVDVYDTWDFGQLIRTSYERVVYGTIENKAYYARYPNNSMFLIVLINYFRIVHLWAGENIYNYIDATIPLNCILVVLSIYFSYRAVCELWDEKQGTKVGILLMSLSPLYAYAAIAYTDIFSIFPLAIILFCYSKAKKANKKWERMFWISLSACIGVIGFKLKATLIIILVAIVIDLVLDILQKKTHVISLVIYMCVCVISFSGVSYMNNSFLEREGLSKEVRYKDEFPITHWIMMSLNPENAGGYVQSDVDFTSSIHGKTEKQRANIEEIQKRLEENGFSKTIYHVFAKKVGRMWGEGDYNASNYVSRNPLSDNVIREIFAWNGKYNNIYLVITQLIHMYMLFMLVILGIKAKSAREGGNVCLFKVIMIGVFLFFLIWECNSRYLLVFLPVISILTVCGNDLCLKHNQKLSVRRDRIRR